MPDQLPASLEAALPAAAGGRCGPDGHPVQDRPRAALIPVDAGGIALVSIAILASIYALSWARTFLIPLLLGIVIAYTLNPLVTWLAALKIPRAVGTVLVMSGVLAALATGTYALRGQVQTIVTELPEAATRVAAGIARVRIGQPGDLQKIQNAASAVESATSQAAGSTPAPRAPATHIVVDQPAFRVGNLLWASSIGALGAIGQAATVIFLVFFLLLGGDLFKQKLLRLAGASLSRRKITVAILDAINSSIQKYMLMLLTTNLLVGLLCWITFRMIGLENAGAWAAAAGMLHIVPYLGPAATAIATGMAAYMQFDSLPLALLVSGASLAIATVVGTFVATWMTGRIANMNSAAIFISLLFWGWLWGIWGMLLSIPIVVIVKVVSLHVQPLHGVAELLGD